MDWELCVLCQLDGLNVIDPSIDLNTTVCEYQQLSNKINEFIINDLPLPNKINVSIDDLRAATDVATNLRKNNAKYHKSCSLELSSSRLQRTINVRDKNRSKCLDETPAKRTRTNLVAESPLRSNICFFCDEIGHFTSTDLKHADRADASLLHTVETLTFDKNIRECASHLGDTKRVT